MMRILTVYHLLHRSPRHWSSRHCPCFRPHLRISDIHQTNHQLPWRNNHSNPCHFRQRWKERIGGHHSVDKPNDEYRHIGVQNVVLAEVNPSFNQSEWVYENQSVRHIFKRMETSRPRPQRGGGNRQVFVWLRRRWDYMGLSTLGGNKPSIVDPKVSNQRSPILWLPWQLCFV